MNFDIIYQLKIQGYTTTLENCFFLNIFCNLLYKMGQTRQYCF